MGKICQDLITHLLSNREKSVKILTEESYSSSLVSWEKSVKSEQLCPPLHFPKSYCFLCVRQRKCMMRVLCMLYVRVYMSMFWECASVRVCVCACARSGPPPWAASRFSKLAKNICLYLSIWWLFSPIVCNHGREYTASSAQACMPGGLCICCGGSGMH